MLQTLASNVRRQILQSAKHHPADVGQACAIRVMHPDWLLHCPSRVFTICPTLHMKLYFSHMTTTRQCYELVQIFKLQNTMWQIVNIASPSPLLHLTDKGIEQIEQFLCFFPHLLVLLPLGQFLCFFPHVLVLLPLEQFLCFFLSRDMSTSSSAPRSTWLVYGPVSMT